MKSPCESDSCCDTAAASCDTGACEGPAKCLAELGCECPIEGMTNMWAESFGTAMKQAQTEILKAKILKAWGPMLDQAANKMMETMGALWAVKIAEVRAAEAKQAFQKGLRDLWLEEKK
jgi:hypothetical protein